MGKLVNLMKIPKIIHYCWFGGNPKPELVERCMESWHRCMPGNVICKMERQDGYVKCREWVYIEWNESNFDIAAAPLYVRQAYEAKKFAFVSDYVRLCALEQYGGVYFDTHVELIPSFNELLEFTNTNTNTNTSFIGFEASKAKTLGTNVIGCEPHCSWVRDMLEYYQTHAFIKVNGDRVEFDMTANSELIARLMEKYGLVRNGKEQVVRIKEEGKKTEEVHIYDYHYFSPITSTRVMRKNKNTFSIHHCYGSWTSGSRGNRFRNSAIVREIVNALIQIKRLFE